MGTAYRAKPLETVRKDLEGFQARNDDFFLLLTDPMLVLSDRRLVELTDLLSALRLDYLFETRVDTLGPEMVPRLKASGCRGIYFGFESASFETLLRMNKLRPADHDQYQKHLQGAMNLVGVCARAGVTSMLGVMVGYPGDTQEDLLFTFDFLRKLRGQYQQNLPDDGLAAGFVVSPSEVYMLRSTAIWKAQAFFRTKGLTTSGEGTFSDNRVRNASNYLSDKEIQMFYKAFNDLSVLPAAADVPHVGNKNRMAGALKARVRAGRPANRPLEGNTGDSLRREL